LDGKIGFSTSCFMHAKILQKILICDRMDMKFRYFDRKEM
jgi:hypothetical protein